MNFRLLQTGDAEAANEDIASGFVAERFDRMIESLDEAGDPLVFLFERLKRPIESRAVFIVRDGQRRPMRRRQSGWDRHHCTLCGTKWLGAIAFLISR